MYTAKKELVNISQIDASGIETTIETNVCPYCGSLNFDESSAEAPVNMELKDVISLKDVPPNEADAYLAQGYVLLQTWQKNVFLVKYCPKGNQTDRIPEVKAELTGEKINE